MLHYSEAAPAAPTFGYSDVDEIGNCAGVKARSSKIAARRLTRESCRFRLEREVQKLQKLLQQEMELRTVLENALENDSETLHDPSSLPHDAGDLLASIATLETSVSKLEEEMVSLHFQLIQERNERRLTEYKLKQLPCSPLHSLQDSMIPPDILHRESLEYVETVKDHKILADVFQIVTDGKLKNDISVKNLWNYPNQLSEEMVRCLKNIFITLSKSSDARQKSTTESLLTSASPYGQLSNSSLWSFSESPSTTYSWLRSPRIDLQSSHGVLSTQNSFDPYKVQGKLSWADIGNYGMAIEVSWMSVRKKQLEYATGALRKFRFLVEQLAKVNPIHMSANEKLAFWINLYNALMMHAYLAYGVPKSDYKLFSLMQKATYTVGGHSFTAAAIEYVLLKMKPPIHRPQMALLLALHKLKVSEEQRKFSIETPEPLVAFALSSGMHSSPAVKIYTPESVREELEEAQRDYIRASVGVTSKGKVLLPKMLHCFARNFVDETKLVSWISRFLPPQQATFIEHCTSQRRQSFLGSCNVSILPYDSRFRYLILPEVLP